MVGCNSGARNRYARCAPLTVRVIAAADRGAEPAPGARYVLTGGVTEEGARPRVMAQLTDAVSREQVWARRYGDDGGDAVATRRSHIAESIAYALAGSEGIVINEEGRRAWRKPSSELSEYDYYTRGQALRFRRAREDYALLRETWREGLARFPGSALLRTALALSYMNEVEVLLSQDPKADVRRAWDLAAEAEHAASLSPFVSMLHSWLMAALCQWHGEDFDRSIALARLTVRMAPYHVRARSHLSFYLANAGRLEQAIEWARWAIRHNQRHGFGCSLAWAYYLAGRHEEAAATLAEVGTEYLPQLAAVYVRLGRIAEARAAITSWLKSFPNVSIARLALEPIRQPWKQEWLADLRAAGLPES